MTEAIKGTEIKWDEMRPIEYHNCYPMSIEIQGHCQWWYDLDDYTLSKVKRGIDIG